jgi:hypothetical protein
LEEERDETAEGWRMGIGREWGPTEQMLILQVPWTMRSKNQQAQRMSAVWLGISAL